MFAKQSLNSINILPSVTIGTFLLYYVTLVVEASLYGVFRPSLQVENTDCGLIASRIKQAPLRTLSLKPVE
jgi:hypothetical protein